MSSLPHARPPGNDAAASLDPRRAMLRRYIRTDPPHVAAVIPPWVLLILGSDAPPSIALGFVPDPQFAELHARIDATYRDLLAAARAGHLPERLPLGGVRLIGDAPPATTRPAQKPRSDDGRKVRRGELRRLLKRVTRLLDRHAADQAAEVEDLRAGLLSLAAVVGESRGRAA